jgi:large subunit ribosomal protein L6
MVDGVVKGFQKDLRVEGVGFKVELRGKNLQLSLGYSHAILFMPPDGIEFAVATPTTFSVKGINKQLVGEIAAKVRDLRPPEPYKGKGIRYEGEFIRRKAGKSAGK